MLDKIVDTDTTRNIFVRRTFSISTAKLTNKSLNDISLPVDTCFGHANLTQHKHCKILLARQTL